MYDAGTMSIDTLALAQRLRARGIAQDQAEEIVSVVRDSQRNLVTTEHLNAKLTETKADILKWTFGMSAIQTLIIVSTVVVLVRH
jgi:hypothetical protein